MERERACVVHCAVPGDEPTIERLSSPLCGAGLDRGDSIVFSPEVATCAQCKRLAGTEQSA